MAEDLADWRKGTNWTYTIQPDQEHLGDGQFRPNFTRSRLAASWRSDRGGAQLRAEVLSRRNCLPLDSP